MFGTGHEEARAEEASERHQTQAYFVSGPLFLIEKHAMNDFIDHLFLLMRLIDFSAI